AQRQVEAMPYRCDHCGRECDDGLAADNEYACFNRKCPGRLAPIREASTAPLPPPAWDLRRLPGVLAIPLREYGAETSPVLKLHRLCDAAELHTRFCTIAALGEWRVLRGDEPLPDDLLRELQPRIERPTFGKWKGMLLALIDHLPREAPLLLRELPAF